MSTKSERFQVRASPEELAALDARVPANMTRSAWLLELALQQSPARRRPRIRPVSLPKGTAEDLMRARALCALSLQFAEIIEKFRKSPGAMPPEFVDRLSVIAGHVRADLLKS